jgi:Tol biopolymer transport system component
MGEVYRARDSKLGRDVAIKVLPEAFARDAERMARFQREAKVLASLDHPNIASIYGLEDYGSAPALVMQLVEGPTLADRIKAGPIPVDEAVRIAKQIADALEYAHERGIIHRDLKPANVKVTNDDAVKVLDFGLAKALEDDPSSIDISTSPTISRMATMQGVLLGTAAYMSPEQAKAKSVDRRADIWAFGCVLYEMLTGNMAFHGEAVTDTLASVIKEEPDWALLPTATPMRLRVLLQRCLQKDPKQRLRDIGDARISLDEVLSGVSEPTLAAAPAIAPLWRGVLPWVVAGLVFVLLAPFAFLYFRGAVTLAPAEPVRFEVALPEKVSSPPIGVLVLSPDGRQLAFPASGSDGVVRIWVRALNSLEARPLPGSESNLIPPFFWSPDSRFIAFDASGKLKKILVSGGPAETICGSTASIVGGSWNRDDVIIFGMSGGSLMRVSAAGGTASPLTVLDPTRRETQHLLPQFLPDGRHFIYLRRSNTPENDGVYVGSLDAKPEEQNLRLVVATQYGPVYVPPSANEPGQLLFMRNGALIAQPFDASRLEVEGDPITVAEGLGSYANYGFFSASTNGVLAYRTGIVNSRQLTWYDRQGRALGTVGELATVFPTINLSPDGTHAAVSRISGEEQVAGLWLVDFSRGTSTRFTFGSASASSPVWSPDGSRIIFGFMSREGHYDLYQKPANGATDEKLLVESNENKRPTSWSRDGRFLLYTATDPTAKASVWVLPLTGEKKPFPLLHTEFNESSGQFSPDGHWIAYLSDESGQNEVYVRSFSPESDEAGSRTGAKWLVSDHGGFDPRWRGDGRELYYRTPNGTIMAVDVSTNPEFKAGVPRVLFQAPPLAQASPVPLALWDVTADGKRFLFQAMAGQVAQAPFTVVLNWTSLLKK